MLLDNQGKTEKQGTDNQQNNSSPKAALQLLLVGILGRYIINIKRQCLIISQQGVGDSGGGHNSSEHDNCRVFRTPADGQQYAAADAGQ